MASIHARKETGRLVIDFRYRGVRCREQTQLRDTAANRKKLKAIVDRMEADMLLGTFRYEDYFPDSPRAAQFAAAEPPPESPSARTAQEAAPALPTVTEFSREWYRANEVRWKASHAQTVETNLRVHIRPLLGHLRLDQVDRSTVLSFRSQLAENRHGNRKGRLSNDRINHVMTTLNAVLTEAAARWPISNPCSGIGRLPVGLPDVHPLSLEQVQLFLENVRPDYRDYYIVRFFTGLRTAEIDGLKWRYVDFERNLLLVRETLVDMASEETKNRYSSRDVTMSTVVRQALLRQREVSAPMSEYVFCNRDGSPLNHRYVNRRIWQPTLRYLGLDRRRPYETRHTAATLWLAAGENPEWIARQLGHSSTEMLFQRYSRFVPNLTRRDGSAFEALLGNHGLTEDDDGNN